MAYGQNQVFVASPQPGTSNQPYPVGRSPAFVPVNATVTNDYAANIEAESLVLSAFIASLMTQLGNGVTPMTIAGVLSGVNDSLTRMADTKIAMAKALANLSIAVAANSVATSAQTLTISTLGGSDLEKNNFYKATSPDTPVMPTVTEQLKVSVTNGGLLQTAGRAANIASSFIIKFKLYLIKISFILHITKKHSLSLKLSIKFSDVIIELFCILIVILLIFSLILI